MIPIRRRILTRSPVMGFVNVECRNVARKTFENNQSACDCSITRECFSRVSCAGGWDLTTQFWEEEVI